MRRTTVGLFLILVGLGSALGQVPTPLPQPVGPEYDTLDALLARHPPQGFDTHWYTLKGRSTVGDGFSGNFYFLRGSAFATNSAMVIAWEDGQLIRVYDGPVRGSWFEGSSTDYVGIGKTGSPAVTPLEVVGTTKSSFLESREGVAFNAYYSGGWKYREGGYAYYIQANAGFDSFTVFTAPSGSADTAVTFSPSLVVDGAGNVTALNSFIAPHLVAGTDIVSPLFTVDTLLTDTIGVTNFVVASNFTATTSITLGGVTRTTWPSVGARRYVYLYAPTYVDGAGCTLQPFNGELAGRAVFTNNLGTNSNWAKWTIIVPPDMDSTQDWKLEYLKFVPVANGDTSVQTYHISMFDGPDNALDDGTYINEVELSKIPGSASLGFSQTITNQTLTGWRTSLTPGDQFIVKVARAVTASGAASAIPSVVLSYVSNQ